MTSRSKSKKELEEEKKRQEEEAAAQVWREVILGLDAVLAFFFCIVSVDSCPYYMYI